MEDFRMVKKPTYEELEQRVKKLERADFELMQAEESLRESEEKYRSLTNNLNVGVYRNTIGPKGKFIEANPAIVEMFGYDSREEYLEVSVSDLYMNPEDRKKYNAKILRDGFVKNEELHLRKKDGTSFIGSVFAVAVKDEKGEVKYYDGIIEDIIEHKQVEEALRESENRFRTLFEFAPDAYYINDLEGNFIDGNRTAEDLLGYKREELVGKNFFELYLLPVEELQKATELLDKNVEGKPTDPDEFTIKRKDGRQVAVEIRTIPIDIGGQDVVLGIARDISERKQAEEEKARLETQVQQAQKMEAIGTLAGGIAHDFNNLLMGIQGRDSLMLMHTATTNPHYEHLQAIEDYVKSAADLTKQLLGFARSGKYEVRPTDLNELIKNQDRMFGRTKKEITIREKCEKNLWTAEVDQGQIEQVLLNLYVNAWQSMPGGGNLYIKTENVAFDENYTKPFEVKPGKYVKISVTDTGVGMDEATRQRIFEPFFTTKEMGRGTGLGLATVYGIIKNHEGFINVYSEKGEGTTFNIYLPASEKEIIEEKELAKEVIKGTETVLMVDDEDVIIDVCQRLLENLGI
jgi:PAS domain S-box-containing protein